MSTLNHTPRRSDEPAALWRHCAGCDLLSAMAPEHHLCDHCTTATLAALLDARFGTVCESVTRANAASAAKLLRRIHAEVTAALGEPKLRRLAAADPHGGAR